MRVASAIFLSFIVAGAVAGRAAADIVELKNGGAIHGEVTNARDRTAESYVIATGGGGRVTIPRDQIVRVVSQTPREEEYHRRALAVADTADAHWQLAQWCRQHKLVSEYRDELAKVLAIDPHNEQARSALGHQKQGGEWMSRDEVMAARGLVMYGGKYCTEQHIALLEQAKAAKQVDADWNNRLDRWRRWLTGRRKDRSDEALQELRELKDPAAGPAVVDLLAEEKDPAVRKLLMDVAARLETPEALDLLVQISLTDPNDDLRFAALEHLIATKRPGLIGPYVRALRSNDNVIVNRAAEALGTIGDRDAVGPLIGALVTKHKAIVAGSSPDQHSYMFTPNGGTAMNFGGAPPKLVTTSVENPAALAALTKLSGANFGFDQAKWNGWLSVEAKAHPVDVRRDL